MRITRKSLRKFLSAALLTGLACSCGENGHPSVGNRICTPEETRPCQPEECWDAERSEAVCTDDGLGWQCRYCPSYPETDGDPDDESDGAAGDTDNDRDAVSEEDSDAELLEDGDESMPSVGSLEVCDQPGFLGNCLIFQLSEGCTFIGTNIPVDGDADVDPEADSIEKSGGWVRSLNARIPLGSSLVFQNGRCGDEPTVRYCVNGRGLREMEDRIEYSDLSRDPSDERIEWLGRDGERPANLTLDRTINSVFLYTEGCETR